jgi:hypothetical protein
MENCGLLPMAQMKSTASIQNKLKQLLQTLGILVLLSTSIFACKQRKKAVEQEKTVTAPIKKVDPKIDTAVALVPHIISISELYVRSCSQCHEAYPKDKYSSESWGHILDSMQKRAHISDMDKSDLYTFLTGDTLRIKN